MLGKISFCALMCMVCIVLHTEFDKCIFFFSQTKEHLEMEKAQLKEELSKANERHTMSQEKCLESQARLAEVSDRLNRAEHTSHLSTQNLATTSASFTAVTRSKVNLMSAVAPNFTVSQAFRQIIFVKDVHTKGLERGNVSIWLLPKLFSSLAVS